MKKVPIIGKDGGIVYEEIPIYQEEIKWYTQSQVKVKPKKELKIVGYKKVIKEKWIDEGVATNINHRAHL